MASWFAEGKPRLFTETTTNSSRMTAADATEWRLSHGQSV